MAWTQADVDNLDAAYKSGAVRTTLADGSSVEFRSIDEYLKLRTLMVNGVIAEQAAGGSATPVRCTYGQFSKG